MVIPPAGSSLTKYPITILSIPCLTWATNLSYHIHTLSPEVLPLFRNLAKQYLQDKSGGSSPSGEVRWGVHREVKCQVALVHGGSSPLGEARRRERWEVRRGV
jgi:hypothetical protein